MGAKTKATLVAAAAAGALAALTLFLLVDRWAGRRPVVLTLGDGGGEERQLEMSKVARAALGCQSVAALAELYKLTHGDFPGTLSLLASPRPGGGPLCRPEDLVDPWGVEYRMEISGGRIRVFTSNGEASALAPRQVSR